MPRITSYHCPNTIFSFSNLLELQWLFKTYLVSERIFLKGMPNADVLYSRVGTFAIHRPWGTRPNWGPPETPRNHIAVLYGVLNLTLQWCRERCLPLGWLHDLSRYKQRIFFLEILLNQTEIRFYSPCTNWFWNSIRTLSVCCSKSIGEL